MVIEFKNLQFLNVSKDYLLLCNSRVLNVYYLNGELINEFKINSLSNAVLVDNQIYVLQMNRKSITCIDIFTGVKKRISFRNDVKEISRIYNFGNKKLILLSFQHILDENNEYKYQARIILYDIKNDNYKLIIMREDEFIDKVLFYNEKPYFMVRLTMNKVNQYNKIYTLNNNDCLEYIKQGIPLEMTNYSMSEDNCYFMMVDTTSKIDNIMKIYDIAKKQVIFTYRYNKQAYSYLGRIFTANDTTYVCVYDEFTDNSDHNLIYNQKITKIYNLKTGKLVKMLKNFYIILSLSNHSLLYEIYQSESGRSTVILNKG